jgi:mannose-6-phosphate isomerase class I
MSQYNSQLYPFCLRAVVKEKVWGGRKLADLLGKALPPDAAVGETWEAWEWSGR